MTAQRPEVSQDTPKKRVAGWTDLMESNIVRRMVEQQPQRRAPQTAGPSGELTVSSSHGPMFDLRPERPWGETGKGVFSVHDAGHLGIPMGKNDPGSFISHIHNAVNSIWTLASGMKDNPRALEDNKKGFLNQTQNYCPWIGLIQLIQLYFKNLCSSKDPTKRKQRQDTNWEIFTTQVTNKSLLNYT